MYHLDVIDRTALRTFKKPNLHVTALITYQIWVKTLIYAEHTNLIMTTPADHNHCTTWTYNPNENIVQQV